MNSDSTAIQHWRKMLSLYGDDSYFFLVRNYLGPVSTPFHKPALTDRLTTFFLNEQHQDRILSLIDDDDALILSAVWLMKTPREQDLFDVFLNDFHYAELQRRIVNLEERLLLLPEEGFGGKAAVCVNPLLQDRLQRETLSLTPLLGAADHGFPQKKASPAIITNEIVRGFLNLVVQEQLPESATMEARFFASPRLATTFPTIDTDRLPALLDILRTILVSMEVIVRDSVGKPMLDRNRAEDLLRQDDRTLLILLLSTALYARIVEKRANEDDAVLFLRCRTASLEFIALARALTSLSMDDFTRLTKILAIRNKIPFGDDLPGRIAGLLVVMGIMDKTTNQSSGTEEYYMTAQVKKLFEEEQEAIPPSLLTIDSDCTVCYSGSRRNAPDVASDLLYLIGEVQQVDTLCRYEITRQSFRHALDQGLVFDDIVGYLGAASGQALQSHLIQLMGEWYAAYHSVRIYDGIVVCCDTRMTRLVDQHPQLQQFIIQRIQEGIYLFSRENEAKWRFLLKNAGADMLPRTVHEENGEVRPFSTKQSVPVQQEMPSKGDLAIRRIREELRNMSVTPQPRFDIPRQASRETPWREPAFLAEIASDIEKLHLTGVDAEEMESRFRSRLLLTSRQVVRQRLYTGLLSASGFDFRGKVNLCKSAVGKEDMVLEVHIYDNDEEKILLVLAKELLNPTSKDALLKVLVLPFLEERTIPVSRMFLVTRQRLSLLGGQV